MKIGNRALVALALSACAQSPDRFGAGFASQVVAIAQGGNVASVDDSGALKTSAQLNLPAEASLNVSVADPTDIGNNDAAAPTRSGQIAFRRADGTLAPVSAGEGMPVTATAPLPVSGTLTCNQSTPANLQGEVGGLGATGSSPVGNPVLIAGSDGTNAQLLPLKAGSTLPASTDRAVVCTERDWVIVGNDASAPVSVTGTVGIASGNITQVAPCIGFQRTGATSPNINGTVLKDAGESFCELVVSNRSTTTVYPCLQNQGAVATGTACQVSLPAIQAGFVNWDTTFFGLNGESFDAGVTLCMSISPWTCVTTGLDAGSFDLTWGPR